MRAVVQRVSQAEVRVEGRAVASIERGLLVLLGVGREDSEADAESLAEKIVNLRIFSDAAGLMNRSLLEAGGALLVVSQFTLYGDCRRGRRPGFSEAAAPEQAERLYAHFVARARAAGVPTEQGVFRAMMDVSLVNQGPVTLLLDSRKLF